MPKIYCAQLLIFFFADLPRYILYIYMETKSWVWQNMPLILALGRLEEGLLSSRPVWFTQWIPGQLELHSKTVTNERAGDQRKLLFSSLLRPLFLFSLDLFSSSVSCCFCPFEVWMRQIGAIGRAFTACEVCID